MKVKQEWLVPVPTVVGLAMWLVNSYVNLDESIKLEGLMQNVQFMGQTLVRHL